MTTLAKTVVPFAVKATNDDDRTITGLAAAWSIDQGNDIIRPGAFARTLDHWRAGKREQPVFLIDQHNYLSINHVLGKMLDARETPDGLEATFDFVPNDAAADAAYKRVKGGYVTGLSIGYVPTAWEFQAKEGGEEWERVRVLKEVKLLEVSLVIWPMNEDARVQDVKVAALAAALKDRRLSDEERAVLRGLLDTPPATAPLAPAAPDVKQDATYDPEQQAALRARLLKLKLARLVTRAA